MRTDRLRRAGRALAGAGALVIASLPALAHPHIWISARLEARLGPDNRLEGVTQTWTFDREYSAFATLNLEPGRPDGPGPEKLAELAQTQLASLGEYRYFTRVKANGADLPFGEPRDVDLTMADGRLTLRFTLPATDNPKLRVMTVVLDDESFFIAFNVARDPEAVRVAGGRGCALKVTRPDADAAEGQQLIPDSEAAATEKAVQAGSDYLTRILLACP